MVPFTRIIDLAAAGALIAFTAVGTPAHADESSKNAGSALTWHGRVSMSANDPKRTFLTPSFAFDL
jgi:hypothetical protein